MSTTNAAQLEFDAQDPSFRDEAAREAAAALKKQAAARLAEHRARRGRPVQGEGSDSPAPRTRADSRAARIAAAVAERYAHSPTYRAFLAAEAERAMQQAEAAAEVAARTAEAVVATQQQLLTELELWDAVQAPAEPAAPVLVSSEPPAAKSLPAPDLTVRLPQEFNRSHSPLGITNTPMPEPLNEEEQLALEEEIAFRFSPDVQEFLEPAVPLPANLIEFPRQLIAARKARPRLAEGPLREDADLAPDNSQLRIFEVQPEQISTDPSAESALPEWSSIRLDAHTVVQALPIEENAPVVNYTPLLLVAPLSLRLMSAVVDGSLVLASFLGFVATAAYVAGTLPSGPMAALAALGVLIALGILYFMLFFTFSDATPGMRYARIGLCTFNDDNPTRSAMRRRLLAVLLAACPAGLGLLWACLDDEGLGWHDRISRIYQRAY